MKSLVDGDVAAASAWATLSEVVQLVTGLATMFVVAAELGERGLSVVAAALAIHRLATPLAQFGSSQLGVRSLAHGAQRSDAASQVVTSCLLGAVISGSALWALASVVPLGVGLGPLLLFGVSEGLGLHLTNALAALSEAAGRAETGTLIKTLSSVARLVVLAGFVIVGPTSVDGWAIWLAVAGLASAGTSTVVFGKRLDIHYRFAHWNRDERKQGLMLATNTTAQSALSDVDKVVINSIGSRSDGGYYALGYRIVMLSFVPISALARTQLGSFFVAGRADPRAASELARRYAKLGFGYGLVVGMCLWAFAPAIPVVFGDNFAESSRVVRWMFWMPSIKAMQYFVGNLLTGLDRQLDRIGAISVVAVANLVLTVALVPRWGWPGAVVSTLVCELGYLVMLVSIARHRILEAVGVQG